MWDRFLSVLPSFCACFSSGPSLCVYLCLAPPAKLDRQSIQRGSLYSKVSGKPHTCMLWEVHISNQINPLPGLHAAAGLLWISTLGYIAFCQGYGRRGKINTNLTALWFLKHTRNCQHNGIDWGLPLDMLSSLCSAMKQSFPYTLTCFLEVLWG